MRKSCFYNHQEIINIMRKLWSQHVYWTRFFIISTAEKLQDLKYVTNRLLENPGDFAEVLKLFYGEKKADALTLASALVASATFYLEFTVYETDNGSILVVEFE